MRRNGTIFGLCSAVVSALLSLPSDASSQDRKNTDGQPDKPATAQQVDDLGRTLKASVDRITDRLSALDEKFEKEILSLRARGTMTELNVSTTQKDINDLKELVARIRQDLDAIRGRAGETRAFYSGPGGTNTATTGRIRMINTFPMIVAVVVNGARYDLMPGEQRDSWPVAAGMFTYEVLGIQPPIQRTLAPGEIFVVNVFPR
jgi:hypothetical protein